MSHRMEVASETWEWVLADRQQIGQLKFYNFKKIHSMFLLSESFLQSFSVQGPKFSQQPKLFWKWTNSPEPSDDLILTMSDSRQKIQIVHAIPSILVSRIVK